MKVMKNFCILSAIIIALVSCSSTNVDNSYYRSNVGDFSEHKLSNEIPVFMKNTGRGQIYVLKMIFEGGTPLVSADMAGIEDVTLDMMQHGSKNYPYELLQKMEYETSFSITSSVGKDYSSIGFKCLEKNLDLVLSVFTDGIFEPLMLQEDFNQMMLNNQQSIQSSKADPSGLLGIELQKLVYADHEYASSTTVTEESIKNITLQTVKAHHKKLLDSKRIKFVLVGNFSDGKGEKILEKLEQSFASIQDGDYVKPVVSKVKLNKKSSFVACPQAGEIGYAIGYFDAPERYDADYIPFAMALMCMDEVLFNYVRESNSAAYGVNTGILGGNDIIGLFSIFKSTKNKEIKDLMYSAIDNFPSQKEIEKKLDGYKSKYITTLFSASQTSSGVAANMATSLVYSGNPAKYLARSAEVQKVTAKQIYDAYKNYIQPKKITWIVVSGEESLKDFSF